MDRQRGSSSPRSLRLFVAVAAVIVLTELVAFVGEVSAEHAAATGSPLAWKEHLEKVEEAMSRRDLGEAANQWRHAYASALRSRHWEGLVAVADAYRSLGRAGGFTKVADAKARQAYLAALFRARQEGSVDGVLRVAEAFADLGDREVVDRCVDVARATAARAHDARGEARVRVFAERWAARRLEVEKLDGTDTGGAR